MNKIQLVVFENIEFDYQVSWNYFLLLAPPVHKITNLGEVCGKYKFETHSKEKDLLTKSSML